MSSIRVIITLLFLIVGLRSFAQVNFDLHIEEATGWNIPGVHSCALGEINGKWIFIGGRINGLQGFLSPFAFAEDGINHDIIVYDTLTKTTFTSSTDILPTALREHLRTNNMQFIQQGTTLYYLGGYGWNDSVQDFITYPKLTAIDLQGLHQAVINSQPIATFFRQITDERFAVCGTSLMQIGSTYYLPFGHRFDGIYDATDTTNVFVQTYTHAIRKFDLVDNGDSIQVNNYSGTIDTTYFRRRDLNIVPQIFSNGVGFTAFSGVFQKNVNKPFTYPIDIDANGYAVQDTFSQMFSHYHSARLPIYESSQQNMSTVFFGGMAMYYPDSLGNVVYDSLVPFVSTISCITRDSLGGLNETMLSEQLPALLGTNSIFIPAQNAVYDDNDILILDSINGTKLVGYIISGIESPGRNISEDAPELSTASTHVFKVYITYGIEDTTNASFVNYISPFELKTFPNPAKEYCYVEIKSNTRHQAINIEVYDLRMNLLHRKKLSANNDLVRWKIPTSNLPSGTYYINANNGKFTRLGTIVITQ